MKINISAIEKEIIEEVSVKDSEEIVGGESGVSIIAEAFAEGDLTFAKTGSDTYSFSYKTELGTFSLSLGFGYGISSSFEAA